jgi:hypothetical protein
VSDLIYPPGAAASPNDDLVYPPGALVQAFPAGATLNWPLAMGAIVNNGSYPFLLTWPWLSGQILGVVASTSRGSFTVAVLVGGVAVPGLEALTVTAAGQALATATANLVTLGQSFGLAISSASGAPTDASVQVNYSRSNP